MSYIYSLISKDNDLVLCEYTSYIGNFMQMLRVILQKRKKNDIQSEIQYDNYKISILIEDNLTFLLLSEGVSSKASFTFLNDVKQKMYEKYKYDDIISFTTYQMSSFNEDLKKIMEYYSNHPSVSLYGDLIEGSDVDFPIKTDITNYIEKEKKVPLVISKKDDDNIDNRNGMTGSNITALNIESVSNELKKEDDNIIVKGRNKGYMIIAGGLTTLLVLFYCII